MSPRSDIGGGGAWLRRAIGATLPPGNPLALAAPAGELDGAGGRRGTVVNRQTYREAMARFGAAVSVVTTDGSGGRYGFTASAVCSVTDDPPTLLVCVNRKNESHPALIANGVLCVNTLAAGQEELSSLFGGVETDQDLRFAAGAWHTLETGAPVLDGSVVAFDCRITQMTEIATHTVLFAHVVAIQHGATHDGLVYFARAYHPVRRP
jgi:flavin reductase